MRPVLLLAGCLSVAGAGQALSGREGVPGPVPAAVIRAVDGDTLEVRVAIWVGQEVVTFVRVRGIDAPELRGACPAEKAMAVAAMEMLAEASGRAVSLRNVEDDKYGGRVVADVADADGRPVAIRMIASGLARAYVGGTREPWCALAGG